MGYRLLGEGRSFYHCVSRVVDRRFVFEDEDKAAFRTIMRTLERFTGVRVVTYCLMSNHFHLLLDVPDRKELTPLTLDELLGFLPELHDPTVADGVRQEIERALESETAAENNMAWRAENTPEGGSSGESSAGMDPAGPVSGSNSEDDSNHDLPFDETPDSPGTEADAFWTDLSRSGVAGVLARYERRRGDLSMFMKMLKQRVSIYMNHRLDRVGTLWESRFKSVLVEGDEAALMAVAAYIDLNPLRAGIAARPEGYRFSGYGEAVSRGKGASLAKHGLGRILREALGRRSQDAEAAGEDWRRTMARYRLFLYETGAARAPDPARGKGARAGIPSEEAAESVETLKASLAEDGGAAATGRSSPDPAFEIGQVEPLADLAAEIGRLLRGHIRYFTDGGVFGTEEFVESAFVREQSRGRLGPKRRSGARRLRGAKWGALRILRDLQKAVLGEPTS